MNYINLEIEQGTSFVLTLTYLDNITDLPINLTGYSAVLTIVPNNGDTSDIIQLTSAAGQVELNGATGVIQALLTPTLTNVTNWTQATWDMALTDPTLVKTKMAKGIVTILPSDFT